MTEGGTAEPAREAVARPHAPLHVLAYALSLPERLLRLLAGAVGGLLHAVLRLVPRRIRETRFYRTAVERQIRILTDDVARAGLFPQAERLHGKVAVRMAVGGTVDNLVMIGLHASPIWMLLAATDVSDGARAFLRELGGELRAAGVLEKGARLDSLDDVLGGLSRLSERLATTLDVPPLALDDMKRTVSGLRDEMRGVGRSVGQQAAAMDELAREVTGLAGRTHRTLLETGAAVALGTARTTGRLVVGGVVGAGATVRILGRRAWQDVVVETGRTIREIARRGFWGSLRAWTAPQAQSRRALFAWRFLTFTEIGLSLGRWRKAPWRLS
jgi:hypothetical protein